MTKNISCNLGFGTACVNYLPYGTILWTKTANNELRQVKLVSGTYTDKGWVFKFMVAGMNELVNGDLTKCDLGNLFPTQETALRGRHEGYNDSLNTYYHTMDVYRLYMNKYPTERDAITMHGTWNNVFRVDGFKLMEDGSVRTGYQCEINLHFDKDGTHFWVTEYENGTRYPTKKMAYSHFKPTKVYAFGDEDEVIVETEKKVEITIKVTETQRMFIKSIGVEV